MLNRTTNYSNKDGNFSTNISSVKHDYYNKQIKLKLKHTKISSEEISDGRKYSLLFSLC